MNRCLLAICFAALLVFTLGAASQLYAQSPKENTNSIGMKLVLIPKGTFWMGSPPSEKGGRVGESQHEVTISNDYYLGAHEVTQAQYQTVMGKNPSNLQSDKEAGRDYSDHPVEKVSWDDANEFCNRLSALPEEKASGRVYRLPTEAEWEYACRAGSKTEYNFGDDAKSLGDYAWYKENSNQKTHPVGTRKPNAWGLYDMHGNVWEWCSDWYEHYPKKSVTDPVGPNEGSSRVDRGGSWGYDAALCGSAFRNWLTPSRLGASIGFRLALTPSGIPISPEANIK